MSINHILHSGSVFGVQTLRYIWILKLTLLTSVAYFEENLNLNWSITIVKIIYLGRFRAKYINSKIIPKSLAMRLNFGPFGSSCGSIFFFMKLLTLKFTQLSLLHLLRTWCWNLMCSDWNSSFGLLNLLEFSLIWFTMMSGYH